MKLAIISFTRQGAALCARLNRRLKELGHECSGSVKHRILNEVQEYPGLTPVVEPLADWTGRQFDDVCGLVFIGAAGIAVRAIAPYIKDKKTDPAVVVLDDRGRFAISVLSGHIGGANELTHLVAEITGAVPVITTATDGNDKTAIDVWAGERDLIWPDRDLATQISAALLEGEPVGFYSDYPLADQVPEDFVKGQICQHQVWITAHLAPEPHHMISWFSNQSTRILRLIPKSLVAGIGCRRGIPAAVIRARLEAVLTANNLDINAVAEISSISLKADETGLNELAAELAVPFTVYDAAVLKELNGDFSESEFVKTVTGIDNVCERAAIKAAGEQGQLLVHKQAGDGVTIAIAIKQTEIKRKQ